MASGFTIPPVRVVLPAVELRHETPDGASHIDWLIATDSAGTGPLTSLRLSRPLAGLEVGASIQAQRLVDHRNVYLRFEGSVSGGRGSVTRIGHGEVTWRSALETHLEGLAAMVAANGTSWKAEIRCKGGPDSSDWVVIRLA